MSRSNLTPGLLIRAIQWCDADEYERRKMSWEISNTTSLLDFPSDLSATSITTSDSESNSPVLRSASSSINIKHGGNMHGGLLNSLVELASQELSNINRIPFFTADKPQSQQGHPRYVFNPNLTHIFYQNEYKMETYLSTNKDTETVSTASVGSFRNLNIGCSTVLPHMSSKFTGIYNKHGYIGIYSPEDRAKVIARFKAKRDRRVWRKKIRYSCRKNLADSRLRINGRFVKMTVPQRAALKTGIDPGSDVSERTERKRRRTQMYVENNG